MYRRFVRNNTAGSYEEVGKAHSDNSLMNTINQNAHYDYDLVVIGGGSGGLASAKEAAGAGKKVLCLDFVKPSPQGSTWGLGGTCVNVGCIPKKLMHQAALIGHYADDAEKFGWDQIDKGKHNWDKMRDGIQDYIGSLNWGYRVQLRDENVKYMNSFAQFVDPHKIVATNRRGNQEEITSAYFVLAPGGRPSYPDVPGMKEYAISSDDLFSLPYCPGRTLVVGASYVALECAGFLTSLGLDTTVMVRSIFLRGFDQQMAEKVGSYMEDHGTKFVKQCVPTKIERLMEGKPGKYCVTGKTSSGKVYSDEFNTILVAVGRNPCTSGIGLETIGVKTNPKNGFVMANDYEQTSVPYVYAIGDVLDSRPELTPVAIQAGRLLSRRLFSGSTVKMDYDCIPTTVFTPLEYGCIGLAEEDAVARYSQKDVEVFHTNFNPLEWTVPGRSNNTCYAKLVCQISNNMRVVGFHLCGPNAGEVTQGFALGMKLGATKQDFDNTVGIHPTVAETFTTLESTKRSGAEIDAGGC